MEQPCCQQCGHPIDNGDIPCPSCGKNPFPLWLGMWLVFKIMGGVILAAAVALGIRALIRAIMHS